MSGASPQARSREPVVPEVKGERKGAETMGPVPFKIDESNPDCLAEVGCPQCDAYLAIHEPDRELPDRLLGICGGCGSWFMIDSRAGLMLRLPDPPDLRNHRAPENRLTFPTVG